MTPEYARELATAERIREIDAEFERRDEVLRAKDEQIAALEEEARKIAHQLGRTLAGRIWS